MVNISSLFWATDVLYGKKPIPTNKTTKDNSDDFAKILDAEEQALRKEREHGETESGRDSNI